MITPFCNISTGSFLKDKIVSREDAMDVLILHLDRSVCLAPGIPATQRWEHLADQFEVPDDIKSQCANFSGKLSSSESLFEHLCATQDSLTVKEVKSCLKKLDEMMLSRSSRKTVTSKVTPRHLMKHMFVLIYNVRHFELT